MLNGNGFKFIELLFENLQYSIYFLQMQLHEKKLPKYL